MREDDWKNDPKHPYFKAAAKFVEKTFVNGKYKCTNCSRFTNKPISGHGDKACPVCKVSGMLVKQIKKKREKR